MGVSVSNVHIQTFEQTCRHLAQQGATRLRPWCVERSVQSEAHNWERLGKREAAEKTLPLQDTPTQDYPFSRRKSTPKTWDTGDSTEPESVVQTLIDPNSNIAQAQAKAMKRALDKSLILAASSSTALDGNDQAEALSADQIIGGAGDLRPMTYDLVTEVAEKFMDNDVEPEEDKVFVVSPRQARKIMQLTEATSSDYNHARDLVTRYYVPNWMGFTWIVSTLLEDPAGGGASSLCFAMTRKALGLQVNRDITTQAAPDPSKSFAWRIYSYGTFGAVRVEDEHLVQVFCDNAI